MDKLFIYNEKKLPVGEMWLFFLFFGWSYGSLGSIGKQILYYITFGGFGLWSLYVLFTLNDKINNFNKKVAIDLGFTTDELLKIGLV